MLLIACPGQGSQKSGFLNPWLEIPNNHEILEEMSEHAQCDLIKHGTTSDNETIKNTQIAQPLIVAGTILSYLNLKQALENTPNNPLKTFATAGHSVGEYAAAAITEILTLKQTLQLVSIRANEMAQAAKKHETSMLAIIGGNETEILTQISATNTYAANFNGPGQIVAAGTIKNLEKLKTNLPKGTKAIPLSVAGAFHTPYMEEAKNTLLHHAKTITTQNPKQTIYSNTNGQTITDGQTFLNTLCTQTANPVNWNKCIENFAKNSITHTIELTPAGALNGILKRNLKNTKHHTINTPNDIEKLKETLQVN